MIRPVGHPPKTSIETIRTLYWFKTVKELVRDELIEAFTKEVEQIEKRKAIGLKYSPSRLRTIKNNILRLNGLGNFKSEGPKFSEISNHIESKALDQAHASVISGDEASKLGGKIWGRYANGTYTPSRIIDYVDKIYSGTKSKFEYGPYQLFRVLESNFITDAFDIFKSELSEYLLTHNEDFIDTEENSLQSHLRQYLDELKKPFNSQNFYLQINKFEEILCWCEGEVLEEDFVEFGHRAFINASSQVISPEAFACFYLSLGFIKFKYLGDYGLLMYAVCKADVLTELELAFDIPKQLWFGENIEKKEKGEQNDEQEVKPYADCVITDMFKRLQSLPNFSLPELRDSPIFGIPTGQKISFNKRGRFSGTKVR